MAPPSTTGTAPPARQRTTSSVSPSSSEGTVRCRSPGVVPVVRHQDGVAGKTPIDTRTSTLRRTREASARATNLQATPQIVRSTYDLPTPLESASGLMPPIAVQSRRANPLAPYLQPPATSSVSPPSSEGTVHWHSLPRFRADRSLDISGTSCDIPIRKRSHTPSASPHTNDATRRGFPGPRLQPQSSARVNSHSNCITSTPMLSAHTVADHPFVLRDKTSLRPSSGQGDARQLLDVSDVCNKVPSVMQHQFDTARQQGNTLRPSVLVSQRASAAGQLDPECLRHEHPAEVKVRSPRVPFASPPDEEALPAWPTMALPPRPHAAMSATPRRPPPMTRASASRRFAPAPDLLASEVNQFTPQPPVSVLARSATRSANQSTSTGQHPFVRLKPSDLPEFSGSDDEDVDDWIGQISHIACYANINDGTILRSLPLILRGAAFKWLHTLSLTDLAALQTWADWQVALRREFRKANYDISKSEQLRARRWRQGEAFSQYFADRRKLQKIVFGENAADQVLISDLLLGVPTNMHALINTSMGYPAGSTITIADFKRLIVDIEHSLGSQYGHLLSSPTAPPSNGLTFANPCTGHLYVEEDSSDEDEADESSDEDETGHTSENGSRADVHDDLDYEGSSACSEGAGADDLGHSDVDSRSEIVGSDGELDARSDDYHSMYDENEESA